MDFDALVRILQKPDKKLTDSDYATLKQSLIFLLANRRQIDPAGFDNLIQLVHTHCRNDSGIKAAICYSFLYYTTQKIDHLKAAVTSIKASDLSLYDSINALYVLENILFNASHDLRRELEQVIPRSIRKNLLEKSASLLEGKTQQKGLSLKKTFEDNNRVVVLCRQFLIKNHAPTNFALQYAKDFMDAGKEVLLINSCELNPEMDGPILSIVKNNVRPEYSNASTMTDGDYPISFYQPPNPNDLEDSLIKSIEKIEEFDPALICVIGNISVVSELMTERAFVFMVPLANDLVLSRNNHYLITALTPAESWQQAEKEGLKDRLLFNKQKKMPPLPQTSTLNRADYAIPDDAFLGVIVGNRLPKELTGDFCSVLDKCAEMSSVYFLFLGEIPDVQAIFGNHPTLANKAFHIPFEKDLMAIYDLCDFYINPPRAGGGSSAYYATLKKLPVLTLPSGDCRSFTVDPEAFTSLDDFFPYLEKMASDPDFYRACQEKSFARTEQFLSNEEFIGHILQSYHRFVSGPSA